MHSPLWLNRPTRGLCALALVAACSRAPSTEPKASDAPPTTEDGVPPMPVVTDDARHLLFSFVDAEGQLQTAGSVDEVPEPVRSRVLVVDLERSPAERQAHRYAFFVDLTTPRPDGSYPVAVVSRYDAAKGQPVPASLPAPDGAVVLYSASWCGYCKKAKAWLTGNGVPFIERDVERTPGAQQELQRKLKAVGAPGGGVPVTDWAGELVMGFDANAFARLKKERPVLSAASP